MKSSFDFSLLPLTFFSLRCAKENRVQVEEWLNPNGTSSSQETIFSKCTSLMWLCRSKKKKKNDASTRVNVSVSVQFLSIREIY